MYKNVAGKNSAVRFVRMEGRKFEASIYLDQDQTIPKEYWDRHESLVSSVIIRKANTFMQQTTLTPLPQNATLNATPPSG